MKHRFSLKGLSLLLVLMLMIGTLAACGDSANSGSDSGGEAEPAASAEAVPEGYVQFDQENALLGLQSSVVLPEQYGWEAQDTSNSNNITRMRYNGTYSDDASRVITVSIDLTVDPEPNMEYELKHAEAVPNTEYEGYINGHSDPQDIPMYLFGDTYLDGRERAYINIRSLGDMDETEFAELVEQVQKSFRMSVTEENELYAADGSLLSTNGLFTFPTEMEIAGNPAAARFYVSNHSNASIRADFSDNGQDVTLYESTMENAGTFDNFLSSNEKNQPFETEVAGYPARGYLYQSTSSIYGIYCINLGDDLYQRYEVTSKGELEITAIQEMMEGSGRQQLQDQFTQYLSDFLSSAEKR